MNILNTFLQIKRPRKQFFLTQNKRFVRIFKTYFWSIFSPFQAILTNFDFSHFWQKHMFLNDLFLAFSTHQIFILLSTLTYISSTHSFLFWYSLNKSTKKNWSIFNYLITYSTIQKNFTKIWLVRYNEKKWWYYIFSFFTSRWCRCTSEGNSCQVSWDTYVWTKYIGMKGVMLCVCVGGVGGVWLSWCCGVVVCIL